MIREKLAAAVNVIKNHKKSLLVFLVFLLLAVALRMRSTFEADSFHGTVEREAETGSTRNRSFRFHLEKDGRGDDPDGREETASQIGEQELNLSVSPLQLNREEAFELLETAQAEWSEDYLGENASANEVRTDLILPDTVCDGLVSVSYESSNYEVLNTDGTVATDSLPAEGERVELTARFSYGEYTRIDTSTLLILPPREGSTEWILRELEKEASQTEESSRQQKSFSLPDAVGGYRVIWEQNENSTWVFFLLLGGVAAFCLEWRGRQEERDRKKKRMARLESEYPQMVDQFAVLLESGMTIRKAWERILAADGRTQNRGPGKKQADSVYLEEMWITYREIRDGRGEREAYERFGNRIGLMQYKRFSSILTQNLSKGTRNIKELLKKESEDALEERKSRARKMGEEAGTKLLFPMLVMLALILMILLMPALTSL